MAKEKYLECGKIVSTHGVRGTVRLECYCDSPKVLATLKTMWKKEKDGTFTPFRVKASSVQKNMVLCTFENIGSLEEAIAMKGTLLYAERGDFKLKKGEHFIETDALDLFIGILDAFVVILDGGGKVSREHFIHIVKQSRSKNAVGVKLFAEMAVSQKGEGVGDHRALHGMLA